MAQNLLAVLGAGVVDWTTPIVRADDSGITRGDGCFEGIRVVTHAGGAAPRAVAAKLERHLARMTRSAAALDIPFDEAAWRDLVELACAAWADGGGAPEAAMKLVLTRGDGATPTGYLTITPLHEDYPRQRREGIKVITLSRGVGTDVFAGAPWLLGGVKTLSYAVNMAAQREAARLGVEDVVFTSTDGFVLEAPTGSVVWAHTSGARRVLRTTPTGATGILAGTTQQLLFEAAAKAGWDVGDELVTVDQLHAADVVWVISSVRGPVDVVDLDGTPRARDADVVAEINSLCGF